MYPNIVSYSLHFKNIAKFFVFILDLPFTLKFPDTTVNVLWKVSMKSNSVLLMRHLNVFNQQQGNVPPSPFTAPRCMQAILVLARVFPARRCRQAGRWVALYLHLTGVWLFVMCQPSQSCGLDESRTQSWLQHGKGLLNYNNQFSFHRGGCIYPPLQGLLMERKPSTLLWNFSLEISGVPCCIMVFQSMRMNFCTNVEHFVKYFSAVCKCNIR